MFTAIGYLKQISLTGGIPFTVTLTKAPKKLNMDLMTMSEIRANYEVLITYYCL